MRRKVVIAGTALFALVLLAAPALAFNNPLAAFAIRSVLSSMGYSVTFGRLDVGLTQAVAADTVVTNKAGEPVFSAPRIEVHYALQYLLPGSNRRRFGISALNIQRPTVTLIHNADGSYNVTLPKNGGSAKPDTAPIDLQVRVRDGSIVFLDRYVVPGRERRQRIVGLAADAAFKPHAHSYYDVRFDIDDGHKLHPVIGKAEFAADRGFESQHWTAADIPIGPLVDFALPSHAINVVDGDLLGVDGRIYAFVDPDGTTHPHLALHANLANGKVYVSGIAKPLRDAHGTFAAYDNGLTTKGVAATLAGVPLHLVGGVYDIGDPKLRFALAGRGRISQLQQIVAPAQRQPLLGDLSFAVRALGSLNAPVVSGTFSAPQIVYRGYPFTKTRGTFSLHGKDFDLLGVHLDYGPVNLEAHGTLALEKRVRTNLVVTLHANGDKLPYVAQVLSELPLTSVVHVQGTGTKLAASGVVYGDARDGSLNATFNVDGDGNGVVGPIAIHRNDGASLYARVAVDRSSQTASGIVDAHQLSLLPAPNVSLPGVPLAALPHVAGTLDAQIVGGLNNGRLDGLAGHVRLAGLRFGAVAGSATADLSTAADGSQRGDVRVATSLGTLDGTAAYANGLAGFRGRLRSSFAQLTPLTGSLGARGAIDGTLLALSDGATSAVQLPELHFNGARVRGIPLRDARGTVTLHGKQLDVRALQVGIAGGTVTVRGGLGDGANSALTATTSRLDLRTLAGAGAPLTAGGVLANALVRGSPGAPRATIAVLVDGARSKGIAVSANAFATYDRGTLHVNDATAIALDSYATAAGDVRGLDRGAPTLDMTLNLHAAQIAPIAKALHLPLRYPDGEIDADLHATGIARSPHVAGTIRIPRGSLNGLNFKNARVAIAGGTSGVAAHNGRVTVGSTSVGFSAEASQATQQLVVNAPHVDLADFNDYFNTAETLNGKGHVFVDARHAGNHVSVAGNVRIDNARYQRYAIGDLAAAVRTTGRNVHATARISAADRGDASIGADALLPAKDPLHDPVHRVQLTVAGTLAHLDLAQWLPVAGIRLPVEGLVDGSLRAGGTLAAPQFNAQAALSKGMVRSYPIDALSLAVNGDARSAHLTSLHVAGPNVTADASGTFGYGAHDPIALALRAQSDDIALLAKSLGVKDAVSGAFATTIDASGTRSAPRLVQTLDATSLRTGKYTLPHLHAELAADPRTLQFKTIEATLERGRLIASATLPIRLTPTIGLRTDPLSGSLRADDIELSQFASLLPNDSKLAGRIDGRIDASGTQAKPVLGGTMTLAGGSYSSHLVPAAFTNVRARLDLAKSRATLAGVHADVGGGALDGTANATFGDLRDIRRTLAIDGRFVASNATVNIANLFRGTINGTLDVTKPQGTIPTIGGTLAFSKTRIPLAALIPKSSSAETTSTPRTVNFDLNVQAANDVRVQGPGVDIGTRGAGAVRGNLARPQLSGSFTSTDGTLSFYRTFVLRSGAVNFYPEAGLIPEVDATATTHITNPDTDVLLHVTGPATSLNLDLASNPNYDKGQILGLLVNAQALGAVPGVETAQSSGGINAGNIAGSFLGNELTQNLLQPVGSQLGQALGFEDLALGYNFGAGFSAGARKRLGKNLYASFNQTFGGDQRQSLSLNYDLPRNASLALTAFNAGTQAPTLLLTHQLFAPVGPTNFTLEALQPPPGVSGVVLNYQRKF